MIYQVGNWRRALCVSPRRGNFALTQTSQVSKLDARGDKGWFCDDIMRALCVSPIHSERPMRSTRTNPTPTTHVLHKRAFPSHHLRGSSTTPPLT